jgi:type I restriction enzyme, S subunit
VQSLAADDSRAITDGPFGSNLKTAHYTDVGPRVIRLQNIGDAVFRDERAHISQEHFSRLRHHEVREGDVVVALLGASASHALA